MADLTRENMIALATRVVSAMDTEKLIEFAGVCLIDGYVTSPDLFHEDWENWMEEDTDG